MSGPANKRADQARDNLRKEIVSKSVPDGIMVGTVDGLGQLFSPRHAFVVGMGATSEDAKQLWKEAQEVVGVTNIVQDIMREKNVGRRRAYDIARAQSAAEALKTPFPTALRDQIMEVLYRDGRQDATKLLGKLRSMGANPTMQELTGAIWSCQKQGWVTFRENHGQHGSALTNIKLTPDGRDRAIDNRGTPNRAQATRVNSPAIREKGHADSLFHGATHAVGIDRTDYRHHRGRAEGGEVENHRPVQFSRREGVVCGWDKEAWPCLVAQKWTKQEQQAQPVEVVPEAPQPVIQRVAAPPRQNEKIHVSESGDFEIPVEPASPVKELTASESVKVSIDGLVGEIQSPTIASVIEWSKYPLMSSIAERNKKAAKYRAAAELLQDDDPEAAVELLEKVKFNELEQEVIDLLADLGM
jgi:hypothetical protein